MDKEELLKIIDICRKKGVEELEFNGFRLKLRDEAPPSYYKRRQKNVETGTTEVLEEPRVTEEDLLFWSSTPLPINERAT